MTERAQEFDLYGGVAKRTHAKGVDAKAPLRAEFKHQVNILVRQAEAQNPEKGLLIAEALEHLHRDEHGEFHTMEDIAIRSADHMVLMLNKLRNVI